MKRYIKSSEPIDYSKYDYSKYCDNCRNFYECDNMGWYTECIPENFKYFEPKEE